MPKKLEGKITRRTSANSANLPDALTNAPFDLERKGGQPRKWDRDVVVPHICKLIGQGGTTMNIILAELDPPMDRHTLKNWRRDDPAIARAIDDAFELGIDRIAMKLLPTMRGKTEAEGGMSTGKVDRDNLIMKHTQWMLERLDNRYNRAVKLANDPANPLTPTKAPVDMTEAELLEIASRAQPPSDG